MRLPFHNHLSNTYPSLSPKYRISKLDTQYLIIIPDVSPSFDPPESTWTSQALPSSFLQLWAPAFLLSDYCGSNASYTRCPSSWLNCLCHGLPGWYLFQRPCDRNDGSGRNNGFGASILRLSQDKPITFETSAEYIAVQSFRYLSMGAYSDPFCITKTLECIDQQRAFGKIIS